MAAVYCLFDPALDPQNTATRFIELQVGIMVGRGENSRLLHGDAAQAQTSLDEKVICLKRVLSEQMRGSCRIRDELSGSSGEYT